MADSNVVHLQGGLTVPTAAFELALALERRGLKMHLEDGGQTLVVTPPELLTTADCADCRRLKPHLIALVCYTPTDVHLFDSSVRFPEHGPVDWTVGS